MSYPTKTADYLASGKPIFVHAPDYASVTKEALTHGWGKVVEVQSPDIILKTLYDLVKNSEIRKSLRESALKTARQKHDINAHRAEFSKCVYSALRGLKS
jgi:glycosyltransferase involved in cell wall biosynthesis